jgi:hypothetical protein
MTNASGVGNPVTPAVRHTKMVRAMLPNDPPMLKTAKGGVVRFWKIDWRALERNKFAPWGVGHAAMPL